MDGYLIAHIGHTIKSDEHITWWKPDSCGYTVCIDKAGVYNEAEARSICRSSLCIAVRKQDAKPLARSTPYFRKSNGELGKLYDGGPHLVVPNGKDEWTSLMGMRLGLSKAERPTPIGVRARAIYLPSDLATQGAKP